MQAYSFPPITDSDAALLILGSMPGKTSLRMQQYYAHRQNAFWRILFNLFGQEHSSEYDAKIELLHKNNIALWDSLQFCERKSSLDSDIKYEVPNAFREFFEHNPTVRTVAFNGKAAERYFVKYFGKPNGCVFLSLPSTSPAYASMKFEEKLEKWRVILDFLPNFKQI